MNKLIILVGPSGVGKGTIESVLFKNQKIKMKLSISATTRAKRENEVHGINYYFISKQEFETKIQNSDFLEWSSHFDNYYGTLKSQISQIQDDGYLPLLEIDTVGALQIIENYNKENRSEELITIFIEPPSLEELEKRMINRLTETKEQVLKRLAKAKQEIQQKNLFKYNVVNDNIHDCVAKIEKILLDEQQRHS